MTRKIVIIAALLMLTSPTALADGGHMGDGMHGMPGRPGYTGSVMSGMGFGAGMALTVADDGTVLTIRHIAGDPQVPGSDSTEVVAISPTGGALWTWETHEAVLQLELAGRLVLVSSIERPDVVEPGTPQDGMEHDSILHALAIRSGAELWQLPLEGRIMSLEAAADMIYAVVVDHDFDASGNGGIVPRGGMHPGEPGQGTGAVELVAVSLDGTVVWKVGLNE